MSKQGFKPHETVLIRSGRYKGMVATIETIDTEKKTVQVRVQGVMNSKPVDTKVWQKDSSMEHFG